MHANLKRLLERICVQYGCQIKNKHMKNNLNSKNNHKIECQKNHLKAL